MSKIVLDANIIISAAFGGIPLEAIHYAAYHTIFINKKIERELFGVIEKVSKKLSPSIFEEAKSQIKIVISNAEKIKTKKSIIICRDPKDNAYLEVAQAANADILITGDKDLLSLSSEELKEIGLNKLEIITPRKFINKFSKIV